MSDLFKNNEPKEYTLGTVGAVVTPADDTDLDPVAKCVEVTNISGGNVLQVLPVNNADGAWITYTGITVGFTPKFRVRRVGEATNCTVVSVTW